MIYLPKVKGLCKSLNDMLKTIYDVYEKEISKENPQNIYLYHDFINNKNIINELNNLGIYIIDDIFKLNSDDLLIIGPLGITKQNLNYLKENNISYIDLSCQIMNKVITKIKEHLNNLYHVLIIGDYYLDIDGIDYINNIDDLKKIDSKAKIYLPKLPKTNEELFNNLAKVIKEKFKMVVIEEFKCPSYKQIIDNKIELKEKYQKVINIDNNDLNIFSTNILKSNYHYQDDYALITDLDLTEKELDNYKYLLSFLLYYKDCLEKIVNNNSLIMTSLKKEDNLVIKDAVNDFNDLNQNGKCIRGTLIALGEYFAKGKNENYINLASAYETFESAILIHDDIIDNAKYRRGKLTIQERLSKAYLNKREGKKYFNETLKMADSIALCVGDYGLFQASKIIYDNYYNHPLFYKILSTYNDIVDKTIKGEVLDVFLPFASKYHFKKIEEEDVILTYSLKTSYYTIRGPFTLGYLLGGKVLPQDMEDILNNMGIYFQIKDDLLSIFKDKETLGKSNVSDIKEFKQTILYTYIINTEYKNEFLKIYGKKNITNKKLKKIRELLTLSGALKYSEDYLDNLYYDSLDKIENLNLKEEDKDLLKGLLIYLKIREK